MLKCLSFFLCNIQTAYGIHKKRVKFLCETWIIWIIECYFVIIVLRKWHLGFLYFIFLRCFYFVLFKSAHCEIDVKRLALFYSWKILLQNAFKSQDLKKHCAISYDAVFPKIFLSYQAVLEAFESFLIFNHPNQKNVWADWMG